mmetsp:Transcript_17115/g.46369  ORF Transcript_17115/g.46369 Transcript_17115/m.46369 type:complete len:353 (+) Transcript_17115:3225-4283(+)
MLLNLKATIIPHVTTCKICDRRDGSQIRVGLRCDEQLDRDLRPRELNSEVLETFTHRAKKFDLAVCAEQSIVLSRRFQCEVANTGDTCAEDQHLPPDMFHRHVRAFDCGAHAGLIDCRLLEHRGKLVQQRENGTLAVVGVHENVVREWKEDVFEIRNNVHLRRALVGIEIVKMQRGVKSHDAHLKASVTRHLGGCDRLLDPSDHRIENAKTDGGVRDVDHEHEDGRLRRPHHVLGRSDVLHGTPGQLGPIKAIRPLPRLVQIRVEIVRCLLHVSTEVARPPAPVRLPLDEGVNVGSAVLASDDGADWPHVDGRHLGTRREWLQDHPQRDVGLLLSADGIRQCRARGAQEVGW